MAKRHAELDAAPPAKRRGRGRRAAHTAPTFLTLSDECLLLVLSHLGAHDLAHAQQVCTRLADLARHGGLHQLADAMTTADPRAGLDRMVEIFCGFWSRDSAVGRLHDAMATDPEFAEAVRERNERRRRGVTGLVDRIAGKQASPQARKDAVDLIFALTSYPTFASLSAAGRSRDEVCRVVQRACHAALAPLSNPSS